MPTLTFDVTKPITISNPVILALRDAKNSPIPLDNPIPVTDFAVALENVVGDFGTVEQAEDGTWEVKPGTIVDGPASADLVYSGNFVYEDVAHVGSGRQSIAFQHGAPEGGNISATLTQV